MKQATKFVAGLAMVASAVIASAGHADQPGKALDTVVMAPGKGLSLDIGSKHAIGYFETSDARCKLTLVIAEASEDDVNTESPGTRFVVHVLPGERTQIDVADGKSAEFSCGSGARKMNARVFERKSYSQVRS